MRITREFRTAGLIALVSLLVFVPFLGAIPLFDWDEVNFAEIAREMILTGDYSRAYIDFAPFWEKPPLFFWLQALSMHLWGIGEFAARFPNAICGVVTLCVLYLIGKKLYDHRFGVLWVLAYGGSILPHLYFRSGIIDPWFNLCIFLSLYFLCKVSLAAKTLAEGQNHLRSATEVEEGRTAEWHPQGMPNEIIAGWFLGLAVLTKGPVAYLIVLLVVGVLCVIKKFRSPLSLRHFALYSLVTALTFGIWYSVETMRNGPWFIAEFTRYQIDLLLKPGAGHAGFPGYHVVVLLFGCFPASVFALQPLFKKASYIKAITLTETQRTQSNDQKKTVRQIEFKLWMVILLIVVLVLFSFVQSKIVHYSSLCYFPITFLATLYVQQLILQGKGIGQWQKIGIAVIGIIYVVAGIALVYFGMHPEEIAKLIPLDQNAQASLSLDTSWEWRHVLPVCFLLVAIATVLFMRPTSILKQVKVLYISIAAFVYTGTAFWVGKVQQYTQGPATEFFKSLSGKDVYVIPWGHKSYSQYWDFRKPMPEDFIASKTSGQISSFAKYSDPDFLLTSPDVGKDVYIIIKVSKAEEFQAQYPEAKRIGGKGGFVFFVKEKSGNR